MRLNNKSKAATYSFISTFLIMFAILSILLFILNIQIKIVGNYGYIFLVISAVLLFLLFIRGKEFFEYDSDGEAVNFRNESTLPLLSKSVSDEFPKYKLIDYDIVDALLFRKLYIKVSSKKSKNPILRYDISYLSRKEIRDLRISLNKIVKNNQNNNA